MTQPHWKDMLGPEIGWLTVCGYRPSPESHCLEPARWHLWLADGEGYIGACATHIVDARELLELTDEHEWGQWCNLPGSVWMQEPPMSWCEQEHGDPLAALELAPLAAAV